MTTVLPGERNKRLYKKVKAALPAEMHDSLDALLDELESDFTEAKESHAEQLSEVVSLQDDAIGALETVKYWLLDVLVHGRPMQTSPRKILRIVEDAL